MGKQVWRGGNMLYPLPAVMVSCANAQGESDIVTVAWTGTVCTNPPMLYISVGDKKGKHPTTPQNQKVALHPTPHTTTKKDVVWVSFSSSPSTPPTPLPPARV